MLSYESFCSLLQKEAEKYFSNMECTVSRMHYQKVNQNCDVLVVRKNYTGVAVDLQMVYQQYLKEESFNNIIEPLMTALMDKIKQHQPCLVPDREYIMKHIIMQMISQKGNEELLSKCPHIPWLDLAYIFETVEVKDDEVIKSTILTNELMQSYEITMKDLCATATDNIIEMFGTYYFKRLDEVLEEMMGIKMPESHPLYLLTNEAKMYGAYLLGQMHVMRQVRESLNEDFYIIPSSIHELLVLPKSYAETQDLFMMVKQVNNSIVESNEILSYSIYEYDSKEDTVRIVMSED